MTDEQAREQAEAIATAVFDALDLGAHPSFIRSTLEHAIDVWSHDDQ